MLGWEVGVWLSVTEFRLAVLELWYHLPEYPFWQIQSSLVWYGLRVGNMKAVCVNKKKYKIELQKIRVLGADSRRRHAYRPTPTFTHSPRSKRARARTRTHTHTHTYIHTYVRVAVFTNTANLGRAWIRRTKTYCIWLRPVKRVFFSGLELRQNPSCYSLLPSFVLSFFLSSFRYYFPHFIFNFLFQSPTPPSPFIYDFLWFNFSNSKTPFVFFMDGTKNNTFLLVKFGQTV